jgi:hypothetical protein
VGMPLCRHVFQRASVMGKMTSGRLRGEELASCAMAGFSTGGVGTSASVTRPLQDYNLMERRNQEAAEYYITKGLTICTLHHVSSPR